MAEEKKMTRWQRVVKAVKSGCSRVWGFIRDHAAEIVGGVVGLSIGVGFGLGWWTIGTTAGGAVIGFGGVHAQQYRGRPPGHLHHAPRESSSPGRGAPVLHLHDGRSAGGD